MRTDQLLIALLPLLLGALLACSGDGASSEGWSGSIETLPNGTVLVRNEAPASPGTAAWELEETTRIGSQEGGGPAVFGAIAEIDVDALGRVYVLDRHAQEIRVFDADGRHVRSFARRGQGPGELTDANGIRYDGDDLLWVSDMRAGVYVAFDTTGAYVTTVRRRLRSVGFLWRAEFGPEGVLLEWDSRVNPDGDYEQVIVAFRLEGDEAVARDTFPAPRNSRPTEPFTLEADGRTVMAAAVPFAPGLSRTVAPDGTLWFGVTDEYRLYARRLDGDTVRIVEREYEHLPVTDADIAEAIETQLRLFVEGGGRVDRDRIPRHKPAFDQLTVDQNGNVWVRLVGAGGGLGTAWDVFDPEGRHLGEVRIPVQAARSHRPVIREDALWTVITDELDVEYVVRYALTRG